MELGTPRSGSLPLSCSSPSPLRPCTVLAALDPLASWSFSCWKGQSSAVQGARPREKVWGFGLVSTSGVRIASRPAQEEQESLTSPLTMGKSSCSKKSKAGAMSVTCQGPFCHSLSRRLGLLANGEGYLERGRLARSWFSDQGSEGLP